MDIGHLDAYGIITVLKKMYRPSETLDRYSTMLALQSCKMIEGESISSHYLTMKGHIDFLDKIGCALNLEVANDLILFSLPEEYKHFILNHLMRQRSEYLFMNCMGCLKFMSIKSKKECHQIMPSC